MKRTTIFIELAINRDLQALARRDRRPVASLVREALAQYVVERKQRGFGLPAFTGIGASGRGDVSERHEDLLWHDLQPHEDAALAPAAKRSPHARSRRGTASRRRTKR